MTNRVLRAPSVPIVVQLLIGFFLFFMCSSSVSSALRYIRLFLLFFSLFFSFSFLILNFNTCATCSKLKQIVKFVQVFRLPIVRCRFSSMHDHIKCWLNAFVTLFCSFFGNFTTLLLITRGCDYYLEILQPTRNNNRLRDQPAHRRKRNNPC